MSKPSPPPPPAPPTDQRSASDDDASLKQKLQHAMAVSRHQDEKSYYEDHYKPIDIDQQTTNTFFPPPLPTVTDSVTKMPADVSVITVYDYCISAETIELKPSFSTHRYFPCLFHWNWTTDSMIMLPTMLQVY